MATSTTPNRRKSEIIQVRVTPRIKQLIKDAADLTGRSTSDFVVAAAEEKALRLFDEFAGYERIVLTGEDAIAFAEAILDGERKPNERLVRSAEKYAATLRAWADGTPSDR